MIAVDCPFLERVARPEPLRGVSNSATAATPFSLLRACHPWQLLVDCLSGFWTAPVTPRPLAWFRVGLASVLLIQALFLLGHLQDLFGRHGIVAWSVIADKFSPTIPTLAWLEHALALAGLPATFAVPLAFAVYIGGLLGLLLGCRTRLAAALAWFSHTALMTSGEMSLYGVDQFAQIGLFYCLCFPIGRALSPSRAGRAESVSDCSNRPSFAAWLGLRILQLHVCIIYTASGLEKASGEQWWSGEAIWRAIMGARIGSPVDCSFLAEVPWLSQVMCWMTILLEAGVVAFVWHPRLRSLWLVGVVGMHLNIALLMNLWTFSATMIVFDVAAFGATSPEARRSRPPA